MSILSYLRYQYPVIYTVQYYRFLYHKSEIRYPNFILSKPYKQIQHHIFYTTVRHLFSWVLLVDTVTVLTTGPATAAAYTAAICRSAETLRLPWPPRGLAGHELAALQIKYNSITNMSLSDDRFVVILGTGRPNMVGKDKSFAYGVVYWEKMDEHHFLILMKK